MKTDIEKLIEVFDDFGITYSQTLNKEGRDNIITIEAKEDRKVTGYSGFVAEFYFRHDGSFEEAGIWE